MDNGFLLAIDDFGTGYSNFEYMKDKMFGILKIDRAFITDIHLTDNNRILVSFIIKWHTRWVLKYALRVLRQKMN